MQLTSNYKLKKPEGTDVVNIDDFNTNADIMDNALKVHDTQLLDKLELYVNETLPDVTNRKKNTLYFKVTDTISSGIPDTVKVSPAIGMKIV